ncbi:hypothetical protein JOM56_002699 [Amanita muscaria]
MHLYLTNWSHLNSTYVDDSGQAMYKVETPNKFFNRVATIKRVLPGNLYSSSSGNRHSSHGVTNDNDPVKSDVEGDEHVDENDVIQEAEGGNDERRFGDLNFGHLAEITFNPIAPSVLRFGGEEHKSNQLFTKTGSGWYGSSRAFIGPDGIEYEWIVWLEVSKLVRRVDSERDTTPIARFYNRRRRRGVSRKRPVSLEIFPEGMHMIDFIVITFVYIQKLRNDKEPM